MTMNHINVVSTFTRAATALPGVLFALCLAAGCSVETAGDDYQTEEQELTLNPNFKLSPWWENICKYKSCTTANECASGELCWLGQCRIEPLTTFCESRTISRNNAGDRMNCDAYACDYDTGTCFTNCNSTHDCAPGSVCDMGLRQCINSWGG